jgi:hypothetical protein
MNMIRWIFFGSFIFTFFYHLAGLIEPSWTEPSPPWRHLLFVLINGGGTFLLYLNNPRYLLALIPLIIQQIYSHTTYGLMVWQNENRIDWASVFVCLGMPLLAWFIFRRFSGTNKVVEG